MKCYNKARVIYKLFGEEECVHEMERQIDESRNCWVH